MSDKKFNNLVKKWYYEYYASEVDFTDVRTYVIEKVNDEIGRDIILKWCERYERGSISGIELIDTLNSYINMVKHDIEKIIDAIELDEQVESEVIE